MSDKEWNDKHSDILRNKLSSQVMLLFKVFMTGSMSAIICTFLLQPLDVIKTRLQSDQYALNKYGKHTSHIINLLKHMRERENLRMLWAGTVPTLIRGIPGGGLYFTAYDWIRTQFYDNEDLTSKQSVIIAMLARAFTDITVIPLTVIKTRMESGVYQYRGVFSGLKQIYINEGWKGWTSGLLPVLVRDIPMSGIYVLFYVKSADVVPEDFRVAHPSAFNSGRAAIAGVLASAVTHPPDVIKTQMQLFPGKYESVWPVVADIWVQHGFVGYFRGLFPRLLKRTVYATVSWTLYEKVKENHHFHDVHNKTDGKDSKTLKPEK